jgi:hypothetical protein
VQITQEDADVNNQSPAHDPDVLPHDYEINDLNDVFYKAVVPDDQDCAPSSRCICGRPDCKICFPPRPPEFGPPVAPAEAWMAAGGRLPRGFEEMRSGDVGEQPSEPIRRPQLSPRGARHALVRKPGVGAPGL